MKLVTFETTDGERRIGAVFDDLTMIADLAAASAAEGRDGAQFSNMLALIDGGPDALGAAMDLKEAVDSGRCPAAAVALADAHLLAPLPEPRQIRDFQCR
jgi:hypothetical protein